MYENIKLTDKADKVLYSTWLNKRQLKLFLNSTKCKTMEDVCNYPIEKIKDIKGLGIAFMVNLQTILTNNLKLNIMKALVSEQEYELFKKDVLTFLNKFSNDYFGRTWFNIEGFEKWDFITKYKNNMRNKKVINREYTDELLQCIFDRMVKENYIIPVTVNSKPVAYRLHYYAYQSNEPVTVEYGLTEGYKLNPNYGKINYKSDEEYYNKKEYIKCINDFNMLNSLKLEDKLASKLIFNSFTKKLKNKLIEKHIIHYIDLVTKNIYDLLSNFNKKEIGIILAHLQKLNLSFKLDISEDQVIKIYNKIIKNECEEIKFINFIWNTLKVPAYTINNLLEYKTTDWCHHFDKKEIRNSILKDYIILIDYNTIVFNQSILNDIDDLLFLNRVRKIV